MFCSSRWAGLDLRLLPASVYSSGSDGQRILRLRVDAFRRVHGIFRLPWPQQRLLYSERLRSFVDVAIIGAGIMGLATGYALKRAGRNVVVYEQFERGHSRGSSHGR